jgi:putative transposase
MESTRNRNITDDCKYHVVFCPKCRYPILMNEGDVRLKQTVLDVCQSLDVGQSLDADLLEIEVMSDHSVLAGKTRSSDGDVI